MVQVDIDGLVFEGGGKPCVYTLAELGGYFAGPSVRLQGVDRPVAHGAYSLPGYRGGRLITLTGQIHARGGFDFERHIAALSALGADGGLVTITVQSEDGTQWCRARLAEEPEIRILVYGQTAEYSLTFFAADPRKYGERREVVGSTVEVLNYGNFGADPVVYVSGPTSGYSVWSGDQRVIVTQPLLAGQFHRIEFETGRLFRDNVLQVGGLARFDLWTVPPGGRTFMEVTGAASMRVRVTDTYI